jgi:hypothetical protein
MSVDAAAAAKCAAYYHYMKDKHDSLLESIKTEYVKNKTVGGDADGDNDDEDSE